MKKKSQYHITIILIDSSSHTVCIWYFSGQ